MQEVCKAAHARWDLKKIAVAHRTGLVRVGEPSVMIAVSSAHRKEALEVRGRISCKHVWLLIPGAHPYRPGTSQACHWAIDEIKASVPIWKKEYFEDGEVWKENAESRRLHNT